MISVTIPIGPSAGATEYLGEAIESLRVQTMLPHSLVIVDDMAHEWEIGKLPFPVHVVKNPWNLGVAGSFNVGVASSKTDCVIMMGADDTLQPDCIEQCWKAYQEAPHKDNTYFWLGVAFSDGRPDQYLPCNAAMVTKSLWRLSGGFPLEVSSGAPDTAYISVLVTHSDRFNFYCVNNGKPLYNCRIHQASESGQRSVSWQGVIMETRNLVSQLWVQPSWGRY